jgi:hypothetical protein
MAGDANTPRKASAKLLKQHIQSLKLIAGILVKVTRAYKSPSDPDGSTQTQVASAAALNQPQISDFENGLSIPNDPQLSAVLTACGFDVSKPGAAAFLSLLMFVRDNEQQLAQLESELPD